MNIHGGRVKVPKFEGGGGEWEQCYNSILLNFDTI